MSGDEDTSAELDRLTEQYVASVRRGERPSVSDYARDHPEHAGDIREIFPLLTAMEEVKERAAEPAPGMRIGPYEVVREIGRGGMGVVYEAVQHDLDRHVALKILPTSATLDPLFLDRFRLEAQTAARLKHPHIVPVIGYGTDDGLHYYSMQYIRGQGVDDLIMEMASRLDARSTTTSSTATEARAWFNDVARMGLQAAEGIAHAHAHGVLHRDIKPSNLMRDEEGEVWVTDFGLCSAEGSDGLTATGDLLGTFRYMPPERFRGHSDVRGDVYGLGITLYEMLTRRKAYEEESRPALAARIIREPPVRPRALDPRIPEDLETIVRTAMAHEPEQRYATAQALVSDLRAYLEGRPIAARAPTLGYLARTLIRRHKPLSATLAVAALLLTLSSVFYVRDLKEKEARARQREYAATVAAVESAIRTGDTYHAASLLESAPKEFRNWEWRHLHCRLDESLRQFESLPQEVRSVTYHPEGSHFAAAVGNQVWIYDDEDGHVTNKLATETAVQCIRWSADGAKLAIGTFDALEIWAWPDCTRIFLSDEPEEHRWVAFTDGGRSVVAGIVRGQLLCYDAGGAGEQHRTSLPARVLSVATPSSHGLDRLVIGTGDGNISVLRQSDLSVLWSEKVSRRGLHAVSFLDDQRVAYSTSEGLAGLRSTASGEVLRHFLLRGEGGAIVEDPLGYRFMALSLGKLHVFDADTGEPLQTLSSGTNPHRAAVHPNGRRAIIASTAGTIREWYLGERGDPRLLARHLDDVISGDLDPAGQRVASCGFGGEVRLWDVESGELTRVLFGHGDVASSVRFAPDGRSLASIDSTGEVIVWDAASGAIRCRWQAHEGPFCRVAYLPQGGGLVTLQPAHRLSRWDPETGVQKASTPLEDGAGSHLARSHNGRWVAVGHGGGGIQLFDPKTLRSLRVLTGHERGVTGLAFDPEDRYLASVSKDQTLRLWDPQTGALLQSSAESDPDLSSSLGLLSVAFSPDGSRIAAGSYTGRILLWSTQELRLSARLELEPTWVTDIFFGPKGERLFTALSSGSVRIWDSVPRRMRAPAYERADRLREQVRPIVAALTRGTETLTENLAALERRTGLTPQAREATIRLLHRREASREGLIRRVWRAVLPGATDADALRIGHGLALGLWRAMHHREEQDLRCLTLMAVARLRIGNPESAVRVVGRIGDKTRTRAPNLHTIDLAVLVLSHVALEDMDAARVALTRMEDHLRAVPAASTARSQSFAAEARRALGR